MPSPDEPRCRRRRARASIAASNTPHSPAKYWVNGIARTFDTWNAAFGVKPGDELWLGPAERVHIWLD